MLDALQTAVDGLRIAETRAAKAAQNIATATQGVAAPAGGSGETPAAVAAPGNGFLNTEFPNSVSAAETDLAFNLVELQLALHAYQANAVVIRAANESFKHLIDSFA